MLGLGGEWQEMRPLKETEVKHVGSREPLKAKLKDRVLAELGETTKSVFQNGYCLCSHIHMEMDWRSLPQKFVYKIL